jgi:hypothetical protein
MWHAELASLHNYDSRPAFRAIDGAWARGSFTQRNATGILTCRASTPSANAGTDQHVQANAITAARSCIRAIFSKAAGPRHTRLPIVRARASSTSSRAPHRPGRRVPARSRTRYYAVLGYYPSEPESAESRLWSLQDGPVREVSPMMSIVHYCQSGFNTPRRFMHIRTDATPEQ